jgi:hypothetical protein
LQKIIQRRKKSNSWDRQNEPENAGGATSARFREKREIQKKGVQSPAGMKKPQAF